MKANKCSYCCIDLKSYYASVECVERGLDPFETPLVVADPERGEGTICLAVSPALKALGVSGRPRVYELPKGIDYIMAPPRMELYMDRSAEIVGIYLEHVSAEDLHVYSVDECFIDLAPYTMLSDSPEQLARAMKDEVLKRTGISATVGIGENLFLAKVGLDILAKHAPDGVAMLDDESFRERIWPHRPITDIWGIGRGIARRLASHGIFDLQGLAYANVGMLYREFGVNAEYLIDHAWGIEPCTIREIHDYKPKERSISSGQVLMRDYRYAEARRVVREQVEEAVLELVDAGMATNRVSLFVGFSKEIGPYYAGGSKTLSGHTDSLRRIARVVDAMFQERVDVRLPIRRLGVTLSGLLPAHLAQSDLFDGDMTLKERYLNDVINRIIKRFGRGILMRGTSFMPGATGRERAKLIGGHRAR